MKKTLQILRANFKYLLVIFVFVVAMFTGNQHNVKMRIKNAITIRELKKEIEYYRAKTEQNKQRLQELESDRDDLEKFARERYRMHAPNEDVYVIDYE
jgi:cell division protein FtsB